MIAIADYSTVVVSESTRMSYYECMNMSVHMNDFEKTLDRIYKLLEAGDEAAAINEAYPYFPTSASNSFHYSLYQFEKAVYFREEVLHPNKYFRGKSPNRFMEKQIVAAYKTNPEELLKLLEWFKKTEPITHEKMYSSESGIELIKTQPAPSNNRQFFSKSKQFLDAYKDKYEMKAFLILLANLVLLQDGKTFSEAPFKDNHLMFNGRRIHRGQHISTGLAIGWLKTRVSGRGLAVLKSAYDPNIRNLSSHNDYLVEYKKRLIFTDNGYRLKADDLSTALRCLTDLHVATRVNVSAMLFDHDPILGPHWTSLGILGWQYEPEQDALFIFQSFAMFDRELAHKKIIFFEVGAKKTAALVLLFDRGFIFPYDMMTKADDSILAALKKINLKESLKVVWLCVAPMHEPFTDISIGPKTVEFGGKELCLTGYKEETLEIDRESLQKAIIGIEQWLLARSK